MATLSASETFYLPARFRYSSVSQPASSEALHDFWVIFERRKKLHYIASNDKFGDELEGI
jgi:hypothetical protein